MTGAGEHWLIEARGLTRVFRTGGGEVRALRGIDLCVAEGEFLALMGPSGGGKTTLLHLLGCLDRPTGGSYRLAGQEVADLPAARLAAFRNRSIGFVFQSFHLLPRLSSLENVMLPLLYRGLPAPKARARAAEVLDQVGLAEHGARRPNTLSGGQQQRVAIARALAGDPALILADEPTGSLDSATGRQIMHLLASLRQAGRTVLLVTHDPEIASYAGRRLSLRDGLLEDGGYDVAN